MGIADKIAFMKFTNVRSTHCGFYKKKINDDDQKKLTPQLAIDSRFFHRAFANHCTM
jgi:hypothetical protein